MHVSSAVAQGRGGCSEASGRVSQTTAMGCMTSPCVEVQLVLLRHRISGGRRLDVRSAVYTLAQLLESVGLAVAEVAEDETTNRKWWVGEK